MLTLFMNAVIQSIQLTVRTTWNYLVTTVDALDILNIMEGPGIKPPPLTTKVTKDLTTLEKKVEMPFYSIPCYNLDDNTHTDTNNNDNSYENRFPLAVQDIINDVNATSCSDVYVINKPQKEVSESLNLASQKSQELHLLYTCQHLQIHGHDDLKLTTGDNTPQQIEKNKKILLNKILHELNRITSIDDYYTQQEIMKNHLPHIWNSLILQRVDYMVNNIFTFIDTSVIMIDTVLQNNKNEQLVSIPNKNQTSQSNYNCIISIVPDIFFPYLISSLQVNAMNKTTPRMQTHLISSLQVNTTNKTTPRMPTHLISSLQVNTTNKTTTPRMQTQLSIEELIHIISQHTSHSHTHSHAHVSSPQLTYVHPGVVQQHPYTSSSTTRNVIKQDPTPTSTITPTSTAVSNTNTPIIKLNHSTLILFDNKKTA